MPLQFQHFPWATDSITLFKVFYLRNRFGIRIVQDEKCVFSTTRLSKVDKDTATQCVVVTMIFIHNHFVDMPVDFQFRNVRASIFLFAQLLGAQQFFSISITILV